MFSMSCDKTMYFETLLWNWRVALKVMKFLLKIVPSKLFCKNQHRHKILTHFQLIDTILK